MKISQKNIIALNLQNAILDNLESWFVETDLINCSDTKDYIRKHVKNSPTYDDTTDCIFLISNTVLGISNNNGYAEIIYSDFLINDLILLHPISIAQLELYRSVIIDWIFNPHNKNELAFKAIQSLQEFEVDQHKFSNFSSYVCVIDAVDLGFKLNDFFLPVNQKFKAIHQFFKTQYQTNNVLKKVNLTKVFFIDQYILGFTFQMEGNSEEHFFWNIRLDEQLLSMDKISFDAPIQLTVDGLLDKINWNGIESLTDTEMIFLGNQ